MAAPAPAMKMLNKNHFVGCPKPGVAKLVHGVGGVKAVQGATGLFFDDQTCAFTVFGLDTLGNPVDVSPVAEMTDTSSTLTTLTVTEPVAPATMTASLSAVAPGTSTITAVITWLDGSQGPYTVTSLVTITSDPNKVSGFAFNFSTPTIIPTP